LNIPVKVQELHCFHLHFHSSGWYTHEMSSNKIMYLMELFLQSIDPFNVWITVPLAYKIYM